MKTFFNPAVLLLLGVGAMLAGCRSPSAPAPVAPDWTLYPKPADSIYAYVVGTSTDQSSPAAAREAAYEDALRQLSRGIVSEAGLGLAALPPGGILLPMEGAEILPGGFYFERRGRGYSGYVQVSFPHKQKQAVIERLRGN